MATKNSDRTAFWRPHLAKFRASGLSRGAYCREHGLKVHQLAYQLDRRSKLTGGGESAFARVITKVPPFVVTVSRTARLVLPGGVSMDVDTSTDPAWVASLVVAVGGRP